MWLSQDTCFEVYMEIIHAGAHKRRLDISFVVGNNNKKFSSQIHDQIGSAIVIKYGT